MRSKRSKSSTSGSEGKRTSKRTKAPAKKSTPNAPLIFNVRAHSELPGTVIYFHGILEDSMDNADWIEEREDVVFAKFKVLEHDRSLLPELEQVDSILLAYGGD